MTARKSTPKATVVDAKRAEHDAMNTLFDAMNVEDIVARTQLTLSRTLAALMVGLTAGGSLAYFGMQAVHAIMLATAVYTMSGFITFMIGFFASALLFVGVFIITGKVQDYILTGGIDRTYESAKELAIEKVASVKSWFKTRGAKEIDRVQESANATFETLRNAKPKAGFKHA